MMRELIINIQEGPQTTTKMNSERLTLRHIKIKLLKMKDKERILKAAREKQFAMYKEATIRL